MGIGGSTGTGTIPDVSRIPIIEILEKFAASLPSDMKGALFDVAFSFYAWGYSSGLIGGMQESCQVLGALPESPTEKLPSPEYDAVTKYLLGKCTENFARHPLNPQ